MDKRGIILIFIFASLLSITFITATGDSNLEKAYDCIRDKVGNDCSALTSEQQTFAILSLGDYKNCQDKFLNNSKNQECWPKSNSALKDTAIALLALDRLGKDTTKIESWLLNQTKTASDLDWFLQIESDQATTCTISYGTAHTITIGDDKKISSNAGSCLSLAQDNYWLKISSDTTCLNHEYEISCNQPFSTTLLYKSPGSETIHVSQLLHIDSSGGTTKEKINYKCFKQATVCNYEGSLWAATVLARQGYSISNFLPYLEASADENPTLFPEAFLYILTREQNYLTTILEDNFKTRYWSAGSAGKKFYDTALAFLALQDRESTQFDTAVEYLLSGDTQNSDGCWNNVADTGFLLYSGWAPINEYEEPVDDCNTDSDCNADEQCIEGICQTPADLADDCEASGYYCLNSLSQCLFDAEGEELEEYECSGLGICCSQNIPEQTCAELGGQICDDDEECPSGHGIWDASDTFDCCDTTCEPIQSETESQETQCEQSGYTCRSDCFSDEEEANYECSAGQKCCKDKTASGKSYLWLIIVLIVLIILVILGIVFRNKLRLLIFKRKFKKGPGPATTRPPSMPPRPGIMPMPRPRRFIPTQRRRPARPPAPRPSNKDKEFEDTLKKLRQMSK